MSKKVIKQETIEKLPVCSDGKRAISRLLEEMGYTVESSVPEPRVGQLWGWFFSSPRLLIQLSHKKVTQYYAVDLQGIRQVGPCSTLKAVVEYCDYKFLANNLAEYFAKEKENA